MCLQAGIGAACRFFRNQFAVVVFLHRNDQVAVSNFILIHVEVLAAICVVVVCFQAGIGAACRFFRNQFAVVVLLHRNDQVAVIHLILIRVKVLTAFRALIVTLQAGCGAACRLFIHPRTVGVTQRINDQIIVIDLVLVCIKVLAALNTVVVCFQAGVFTGCRLFIDPFTVDMTLFRDDQAAIGNFVLLCIEVLIAFSTLIVTLQAGALAGRRLFIDPFTVIVTQRINDQIIVIDLVLVCVEILVALRALIVSLQAGVFTGCRLFIDPFTVIVTQSRDDQVFVFHLVLVLIEVLTAGITCAASGYVHTMVVCLQAVFRTGCRLFRDQLTVVMTQSRDDQIIVGLYLFHILGKELTAGGTGTGIIDTLIVVCQALICTGRRLACDQCHKIVTQSLNDQIIISDLDLAGVEVLAADRAFIMCPQAILCTGCRLGNDPVAIIVSVCRDLLGLGVTAFGTGVEDLALVFTVRGRNLHAVIPLMGMEQIQLCTNIFNADIIAYTVIPVGILFIQNAHIILDLFIGQDDIGVFLDRAVFTQQILIILEGLHFTQEILALIDAVIVGILVVHLQERAQGVAGAVDAQLPQYCSAQLDRDLKAQHIVIHRGKNFSLCLIGQCQRIHHIGEEVLVSFYLAPAGNDLGSRQGVVNLLQLFHRAICIVSIQGTYHIIPDLGIAISKDHRGHYHIFRIVAQVHHHFTGKITGDLQGLILQIHRYVVNGDINIHIVLYNILQRLCRLQKLQTHITGDHYRQRTGFRICDVSADVHSIVGLAVVLDLLGGDVVRRYQGVYLVDHTVTAVLQCLVQLIVVTQCIHDILCNGLQVFLGDPALQGIDNRLLLAVVCDHTHNIFCLDVKYLLAIQVEAGVDIVIQCQLHSGIQRHAQQTLLIDHLKQIVIICIQGQGQVVCAVVHHGEQLVMYRTACILYIAVRQQSGNIGLIGTAENRCTGHSTGDRTHRCHTTLVSAVKDDHSAIAGNASVYGLAVQVHQHRHIQFLILDANHIAAQVQVGSHIIQQDNEVCAFCDSGQLISSCQTSLIDKTLSRCIHIEGSVVGIHILNMASKLHINAGIILLDDLGQINNHILLSVLDELVQLHLNLIQEFLHTDILQGNVYALALVQDIFAIVSTGDDLIDHFHCTGIDTVKDLIVGAFDLIDANAVDQHICCVQNCIPLGSILIQHRIEHIHQECQRDLGIQIVHVTQIDLAGGYQSCNVSGINRLRHCQVRNSLAVFKGELEILVDQRHLFLQVLHRCLVAVQSHIELSFQRFAILLKGGIKVHQFCAQGGIAVITDHSCTGQLQMLQGTVVIDFFQYSMGTGAAVEHCINECLEAVLAVTVEHKLISLDLVIAAHKQAHTKAGKAIDNICIIDTENDRILAFGILGHDGGAFHMVDKVDQHIFLLLQELLLLVDLDPGNLHCAGYQLLELVNSQLIGTVGYAQITDVVIVTHTGFGMSRQLQVHIVIIYVANYHVGAVNLDLVVVGSPGVVELYRLAGEGDICKISNDREVFRILRSNVVCSHHCLCPGFQLCSSQCCAGSFHVVLGEGHTAKGNIQNYIGVIQTGNMHILLPLEYRHAAVQAGAGGLQQSQQGAEVLILHIDLGVIHAVVSHYVCGVIQRFSDLLKQILGCHMDQVHKCRIVHQNIHQFIQLGDLGLVQRLILIIMVHTAVGIQFHCIVKCHVALNRDQLIQDLTGSNRRIAEAVACLQVLYHTQCFPEGHRSGRGDHIILVVQLLQQWHQLCQLIQADLLCVILSCQIKGCIQGIQQLHRGKAQSGRINGQLIMDICCLEIAVGCLIGAVCHRVGHTVNGDGVCDPLQAIQAGIVVRGGDHSFGGAGIVSNRDLILAGQTHTECIGKLQSRACKNVLNICVCFHSLGNQIQKIQSFSLLTLALGDQRILCHCQHTALLQLRCFRGNDSIDVFHRLVAVDRCGVAVTVGYIQYIP